MGIFEVFMKIFPEMKMKDSNIGVEYVPLGKPEELSRYLVRAEEKAEYCDKALFPIKDRDGLYYEKPNMIDKYLRRGDQLKEVCLAQFVKMYDPTRLMEKSSENENSEEEIEEDNEDSNENEDTNESVDAQEMKNLLKKYKSDFKFHLVIQPDGNLGKKLPNHIKLVNPIDNEPPFMKKRNSPKALRFYKPKYDSDPNRYYLQEL